jgi:vitamin B12 transporter
MEKLIQRYATKFTRFTKVGACLLLLVFLTLPGSVLAQADTSKKLKEVKIQNAPIPQVQTITPSQQITSADFARYSALTVADAIRDFAGVNIKDYGGIGGLKTVSIRSLGANHLAVLYDGVQLSDAQNGQIDLGKLNLNNIQSITLYNGQPSQICQPARSFASASVLAITTIRPKLDSIKPYQVTLGVNGGSFGLINPYLQWQQRINSRWSFIVNSYIEKANGKYKYDPVGDGADTLATRLNGDVSMQQVDGALYWAKNENNKFNLHINYYNSNDGVPGAVVVGNTYSVTRLRNQDFFMQAGYERQWENSLHLLVNSKFASDYIHYTDPAFLNGTGGSNNEYSQFEFYQSVALAYNLTANWQLSYSADAAISKLNANLDFYAYPSRFTLLNVLASNLTLGKWLFQGSLLLTKINEKVISGNSAGPVSALSPTLVVNYHATQNLQLRAYYKDIFRMPSFNEQYYFYYVPSRNLKPEKAKQYDVGLTYSKSLNGLFNYVALTADGYFNRVNNKIVSQPNQNPSKPSIINLGQVDIKGLDVGIKTQTTFTANFKGLLSVNYTYQQALNVGDDTKPYYRNQIPYTPEHALAVNAGVSYKRAGLYYNQVLSSDRYFENENKFENLVPGYSVSDLTGTYALSAKAKKVNFSISLNNVFNSYYDIVRNFPMPGRSVKLSMQITI